MWECGDVKMRGYENERMWKCENGPRIRCFLFFFETFKSKFSSFSHFSHHHIPTFFELKLILPHHAFNRLIRLTAVFRIFLLVIFYFSFPVYYKINQLTDRHPLVHFYRLLDRDFKRPVTAKAYIPFTGCGMNVDPKAACRGFAFQERHMGMRFCIFFSNAQVENISK
jgi:hypothetical protein